MESSSKLVISPSKAHYILLTKMRDANTSSEEFVKYAKRSMTIVAEDALAEFPTKDVLIQTPCGPFMGSERVPASDHICAVSIVRSGDCLLESVRAVEPACKVGKILIQRDESQPSKLANLFYCKLPPGIEDMWVLLCDPMLATGGSAVKALELLCNDYKVLPERIIFANMICAPEGLQRVFDAFPSIKIVTAAVDDCLNEDKFIVPGLGDYGDRFFNTS